LRDRFNGTDYFFDNRFLFNGLIKVDELVGTNLINEVEQLVQDEITEKQGNGLIYEPPVHFPPTYKLIHKGYSYVLNEDYIPSYTDRIFVLKPLKRKNVRIEDKSYECCFNICKSDHKPVYAQFAIQFEEPAKKIII